MSVVHQYLIYSHSQLGLFRGSGGPNEYFHNLFELSLVHSLTKTYLGFGATALQFSTKEVKFQLEPTLDSRFLWLHKLVLAFKKITTYVRPEILGLPCTSAT